MKIKILVMGLRLKLLLYEDVLNRLIQTVIKLNTRKKLIHQS